jgi:hypothetical protein
MVTCQDDIGLGQLELTVALMSPLHQLRVQRDIDHLRRHGSIVCAVGGTASGITGVHEWLFNETPAGTQVTTNESFAGDPVSADPASMRARLDASLAAWLDHLKAAAESTP